MTTGAILNRVAADIAVIDTRRYRVRDSERDFAPGVVAVASEPDSWISVAGRAMAAPIYEMHYLGRADTRGDAPDQRPVVRLEDAEFGRALRAANAGRGWVDPDWTCLGPDGDAWRVARKGITLRARREELDRSPVPGERIGVRFPNALPYVSRGFYMSVADAGPVRTAHSIQRIYVNVSSDAAAATLGALTQFLQHHGRRGQVKVVNHPSGFDRPDACTLYLERDDLAALHRPLGALLGSLDRRPEVPGFCYRWMRGVGFAEEPRAEYGTTSFGEHRSRLLGTAIARAFAHGRSAREGIRDELDAAGIDPDRLFLNPGTPWAVLGQAD